MLAGELILSMRKMIAFILLMLVCSVSQGQLSYQDARQKLYSRLLSTPIGPNYLRLNDYFFNKACDSLVKAGIQVDGDPIESILLRLFGMTELELDRRNITPLRVPSVNMFFLEILRTYKVKPLRGFVRDIGVNRLRILANAFVGLPLGDTLQMAVSLKEAQAFHQRIPALIGQPKYERFSQQILSYFVSEEPEFYLREINKNEALQRYTAASTDQKVLAVHSLKDVQNTTRIIPFSLAIQEGRMTLDSVRMLSEKPRSYLAAYTKEVFDLYNSEDSSRKNFLSGFLNHQNAEVAKMFVGPINQLHESADRERYYVLRGLTPQELYLIMVGGSAEFYTSSFTYTFNLWLKEVEKQGIDSFFNGINYYEFGKFLNVTSGYGLFRKFIEKMDQNNFARVFSKYLATNINSSRTDRQLIVDGMSCSEILWEVRGFPEARNSLLASLTEAKAKQQQADVLVQRMYTSFSHILQDSLEGRLKAIQDEYNVMAVQRLKLKDTIVQVGLFYDDEDGASSFRNYLSFLPESSWSREDRGSYMVFRSKTGNPFYIFLNKPNSEKGELAAQQEMLAAVENEGLQISYFTHRGHSYHLLKSLKLLPQSSQIVYLGSCGGYNEVYKVFEANPDAHIISTRNVGSRFINDPILSRINQKAIANENIPWNEIWSSLDKSFTSKNTRDLFSAYIPPNRYIGIMFIRDVLNF
jgi:hypothetical protein